MGRGANHLICSFFTITHLQHGFWAFLESLLAYTLGLAWMEYIVHK